MKKEYNNKSINSGMLLLFLVGCLITLLVGGYSLTVIYTNDQKDNIPSSEEMQINSGKQNISTTPDGATATVIE